MVMSQWRKTESRLTKIENLIEHRQKRRLDSLGDGAKPGGPVVQSAAVVDVAGKEKDVSLFTA